MGTNRHSALVVLAALLCIAGVGGCPGNGGGSDTGGGADSGPQPSDAAGSDSAVAPDASSGADTATPSDAGPQPDSAVEYVQEVTLGYDDGIPIVRLKADPNTESRLLVTPDSSLLPVEVRRISWVPTSAYGGTLTIHSDSGGFIGATLATQAFTVTANDVDDWFSVDIESQHLQVDGDFWVKILFPATLSEAQETMIGGSSSSGHHYYWKTGYPLYMVNFDPLMRVVVGTPSNPNFTTAQDGEPCDTGLDCSSGFCSGGKCTISCASASCGARRCDTLEMGEQVCVTPCADDNGCDSAAFCLTDTTFFDPAGFCVADGPIAQGQSCQYHYHTVCSTGYCEACVSDPVNCEAVGNCVPPP